MKTFRPASLRTCITHAGLFLWAMLISAGLFAQSQTFNSSGTFIVPAGVTSVTVQAWGGGGGGANGSGERGGGGGGAYASSVVAVSAGQMITVTVGGGGSVGMNGGNSSFGASVIAEGGESGSGPNGGDGGSAASSTGTITSSGGDGGDGNNNGGGGGGGGSAFTNASGQNGEDGGGSSGGDGGNGTGQGGNGGAEDGTPNAQAGSAPGGGGGGRGDDAGSSAAGAAGRVVVQWCVSGPVTLPYNEGFETVGPTQSFTADQASINGLCNWEFDEVESSGRLQFDEEAHTGSKAALMDRANTGSNQTNFLISTIDLSNYSCATNLTLSFWHAQYGDEDHGNDRVWIRGSNSDSWIEIHDLTASQDDDDGDWVQVTGLDIDQTLSNNGQSVSSTFQIRFGQEDNASHDNDGRAFDDISITGTSTCPPPQIGIVPTHLLCNGANGGTGSIDITVTDGNPPFTYSWSNLPGAPDPEDQSGLAAGTYTVTVTDFNNVTATASTTLTQPPAITGNATPSSACNINDGSILVTASGGTPGYQVSWSGTSSGNPAGVEIAVSGGMYSITGLTVGSYTVTVADANGCSFTTTQMVTNAGCCMVSADAGSNQSICPGTSTAIGGAPTGSGTPTLSYAWSPAGTLDDATAANPTATPVGNTTYTVTVTSSAGCTNTASVTVTLYPAVTASASATDALCNGGNGSITMTMGGGNGGPYNVSWSGPVSNSSPNKTTGYVIMNLPAGLYTITVTDGNSCTQTATATVGQPAALTASGTPTDVSCTGDANGKITMTIGGGTSPYDITWNGPGANDGTANNQNSGYMINNLPAGDYDITVTDDHGCTKTTSVMVGTANPLPDCSISDGMADVCPNSAGNQYSAPAGMDNYAWSIMGNGSIPGSLSGQSVSVTAGASGAYTVTVTITKNGCSSTCSKTVNISMIPFMIVSTAQYCQDDPGPVIGLNGTEAGAMYQLQTAGGMNVGAPVVGTGAPIVFGSHPNGNYKVIITGGTCDGMLQKSVNGTVTDCTAAVPNFCACNAPNGRADVTVKVTAPAFQMWTVVEVIGLYGPNNPYPPITPGTPLTYVGMGMYTLQATRDNLKGYYVKVSNGFTEQEIQVGNPSW